MKLTQQFLSLGKKARGMNGEPVYFTKPIDRIIIHWIGPYPGQGVTTPQNWWENGGDGAGVQASAHFIAKDENVLQCLPLNEVGKHSGDSRNYSSIGIEVIPMNTEGEFSEATKNTLKELVAYIRGQTKTDLKLERHFDCTQGKDCPRFYTPVTSLLHGGGRVANPPGGDERWEELKQFLNEI